MIDIVAYRTQQTVRAPVTFGFDANDVLVAADTDSPSVATAPIEKYHLNYIEKPPIILLR